MMDKQLSMLAGQLGLVLISNNQTLATAESCTGGWIAKVITDIPGSSGWFDRGFVTYCNQAKQQMLGVQAETLSRYGAVSAATVYEMVTGALLHSEACCAVAVTGIAGPEGGSLEKPVGTVFFAWQTQSMDVRIIKKQFTGDRQQIRALAVKTAIEGCLQEL